jgi:hypothetical protein
MEKNYWQDYNDYEVEAYGLQCNIDSLNAQLSYSTNRLEHLRKTNIYSE